MPLLTNGPSKIITRRAQLAAGWWVVAGKTCVAAYQPKGAASLAASYVNLVTPGTYDCTVPTAAPTLDANGWIFNGSSQFLTTGIAPNGNYSMLVCFSDGATTGDHCICGTYPTTTSDGFSLWQITAGKSYYCNSQLLASANYITSGVLGLAGKAAYKNGTADGTIGAGAIVGSNAIFVGKNNNGFATSYWFAGKVQALVIYSDTLTAGQMATVSAAMAAL